MKRAQEDQFIAGTGQISNVVMDGGSYTHKSYGVISESGETVIPLDYDSVKLQDDGKYVAVAEENTRLITRTFFANGNLDKEEIEEKTSEELPAEEE